MITNRLHVFMQSMYVEVQERANTLKQIFILVGILTVVPSDEDDKDEEKASAVAPSVPKEENAISLLDGITMDMPAASSAAASTPSPNLSAEVMASASPRVTAARNSLKMLEALSREAMNPVNPKAQKKVPLPDGLDLDEALNAQALEDLFAPDPEAPKPITDVSQVSFTNYKLYSDDTGAISIEGIGSEWSSSTVTGYGDRDPNDGDGASREAGDAEEDDGPTERPQIFSSYGHTNSGSDPFYIRAVHPDDVDVDDIPMLKLRAEDLEGPKKGKGKKGKKEKKAKKKKLEYNVNMDDMDLPAGLVAGDDDGPTVGASGRRGKRQGSAGLGDVDLSTPLRDDEVMPERKHRVVDTSAALPGSQAEGAAVEGLVDTGGEGKKKKEKKSGKGKKGKKEEEKSGKSPKESKTKKTKKKAAPAGGGGGDLLDLMGFEPLPSSSNNSAPPPAPAPASTFDGFDLLGDFGGSSVPPPPAGGGSAPGKKSKKSKEKGSGSSAAAGGGKGGGLGKFDYWMTVSDANNLRVEVKTSVSTTKAQQVKLTVRCRNTGSEPLSAVEFGITNTPAEFRIKSKTVAVAPVLEPGAVAEGTVGMVGPASLDHAVTMSGAVKFTRGGASALLADAVTSPFELPFPSTIMLIPVNITADDFMGVVQSRATNSTSVKIPNRQGTPDPVATVAGFLHGRVVARDKSSLIYGQFPSGDDVCVLVKVKESGVSVDVKCSLPVHAQQISADLRQLPL